MRFTAAIVSILILVPAWITGAQTLHVGPGLQYASVGDAAQAAMPGDTILVAEGEHTGGDHISDLQGTPERWITILAEAPGNTIVRGGSNAWQLSDAAYLRIEGFIFEGQTGNGVNIDDAGTFNTPTHHIVLQNCEWRALNATGNNDQLKLSGLDSFVVRNCWFVEGSAGGSCIDMVGCHNGIIEANNFINAGSNSIQAKGGTRSVIIQRNSFYNGGERGINIGGSTGLQFFRPQGAKYEASEIGVYGNIFEGGTAAFAFVGAVNSEAVNNTIVFPEKWIFRILQETTEPGFLPCGNNRYVNNIAYIDNRAASPSVNIGPNTAPETFTFTNNLWYNTENSSWSGPNLPAAETDGILNRDPLLNDVSFGDFSLKEGSPAIGMGVDVRQPEKDFEGFSYNTPRSIGAYEGDKVPVGIVPLSGSSFAVNASIFPNPSRGISAIEVHTNQRVLASLVLHDLLGRELQHVYTGDLSGTRTFVLRIPAGAAPGTYFLSIESEGRTAVFPFRYLPQ